MTAPDNDDLKRAEEIMPASRVYFSDPLSWPETREVFIRSIAKALSEERARTLNSEAVQLLIGAFKLYLDEGECYCTEKEVGGSNEPCGHCYAKYHLEKFQQYALNNSAKDGK